MSLNVLALALRSSCLELGEHLLDRIKIRRVGRQKEAVGASATDRIAHSLSFVRAEAVHNDNVAWVPR